jgi:hypothetical protein
MIRFFLPLILLSTFAAAQTVGQYEIRKRGASGFTSYGVTLSNGQVFGQTAGSPAAITPFGGAFSDLSGKPTTLNGYGITDGLSTSNNLSDLANAATARTNLGLGAAATLATSTGGNYTADGGKALIFGSFGEADMSRALTIHRINSGGWLPGVLQLEAADNVQAVLSPSDSMGSFQTFTLPAVGGTLIGTGNLTAITATGTITSGTWQGSIIAPAYLGTGSDITTKYLRGDGTWQTLSTGLTIGATSITGGTADRLLTSGATVGELTLGSGVSTWLITPSSANLRSALTDETGSGAAVFATSPTLVTPVLGVASATDLSTSGRFFGASEPGYPQFTETGYPGNGMRVYSDRLDFWIGSSVIIAIQAGTFNVPTLTWAASSVTLSGTSDGAGRLVQKGGTSPMSISVANTYTSFTNKEEFEIGWVGNSNVCRLRPIKGSGGGSSRNAEFHTTETGVNWGSGSGSPEGVRTAPVGSLYTRTDGGSNTTLYVKESGTGNTGWVAK